MLNRPIRPIALNHLLHNVVLGIGLTLMSGVPLNVAYAEQVAQDVQPYLALACHMTGGGYAIRDMEGGVVENGDGAPFALQPRVVLRITAKPPQVWITEGSLPHPHCAAAPLLTNFQPIRFTWCSAYYEVIAETAGEYRLRSTASSTLKTGIHKGKIMEAFMIGACTSTDTVPPRR